MTRTQQATISAAVSAAIAALGNGAGKKAKGKGRKGRGRVKSDDATLQANAVRNAKEAEELFKSKGFEDCRANETILTYKKWLAKGRKVKEGEKSLKTSAGYPLFHISQTSEVDVKSVAVSAEQANEATAH